MIEGFKPDRRYLVVTPLLSECDRIIADARIPFQQPMVGGDNDTKKDHLTDLLIDKKNIVTTHAMFDSLADLAEGGYLDGYDIVIDEVMSVVDDSYRVQKKVWEEFYLADGYVTIDRNTGKITPTVKWEDAVDDVDEALSKRVFKSAMAGRLYHLRDGINLAVMPEALLKAGRSLTVYTFKAEGSLMYAYLKRLGLNPTHDTGGPEVEQEFVRKARDLITVKRMPSLEKFSFSYTGQTKRHSKELNGSVPKALASLRRNGMAEIDLGDVLITSPKVKWYHQGKEPTVNADGEETTAFKPGPYAKGSRFVSRKERATWIPNTTRGTNDYKHATHLIYLYDQYINPYVVQWFGGESVVGHDDYALTELIQIIWRTQVREDKPITVYIPSERMRELFLKWLWEGQVPTSVRDAINKAPGVR
jgi:hypothetical protein